MSFHGKITTQNGTTAFHIQQHHKKTSHFSSLVGTPQRNQIMCFQMASVLKKYLLEVINDEFSYMGKFMCRKIKTQGQKFNPGHFSLTHSLRYSFLESF